jgi:hypothetical protein
MSAFLAAFANGADLNTRAASSSGLLIAGSVALGAILVKEHPFDRGQKRSTAFPGKSA